MVLQPPFQVTQDAWDRLVAVPQQYAGQLYALGPQHDKFQGIVGRVDPAAAADGKPGRLL